METKLNWGKGLIIGMAMFMLFIIALGVTIFSQKTDDYDHDYYEKGLEFNHDYDREHQVVVDNAKPVLKIDGQILDVTFVAEAKGNVRFIRPSDSKMDKQLKFESNTNGLVNLPLAQFEKGRWQLVFEWNSRGKQYLYQQEIFVQ